MFLFLHLIPRGQFDSAVHCAGGPDLRVRLEVCELEAREVSIVIGGPDGLPQEIRDTADYQWSLSRLTLPHDLAMVVTLEALFRASTLNAGLPYHR